MKPQRRPPRPRGRLFGKQQFLGSDAKAWLANGLEELRSVFTPNTKGVELGNTPGTMFTPTTGEQTAARLGDDYEKPRKMTLAELKGNGPEPPSRTQEHGREM